ncbi:MFS transporter [Streptomyces malaysiensis]|uniref:MFS transporter n=1 Tax=Streptomyces malaysiensis TaxID=92644 RepID=UPI002B2D3000|nr:MFS transporter [Streptomyces malaysiensis]
MPFLLSFALLAVGAYTRFRITESPLFDGLEAEAESKRTPIVEVLRRPGTLTRGIVSAIPPILVSSLFGSFAVAYAVNLGMARSAVLFAVSIAWPAAALMTPLYGAPSDRFGRRPVHGAGAVAFAVSVWPVFWAIGSGSTVLMTVGFVVIFGVVAAAMSATLAALLSEMFPTAIRYSGISAAYQVATIVAGFSPLAAGALPGASGGSLVRIVGLVG